MSANIRLKLSHSVNDTHPKHLIRASNKTVFSVRTQLIWYYLSASQFPHVMSTYRTGSSHNTHWAASTNLGTLKSWLNMKTASIVHFNFRAKWHQQNLCGEASVKPKSWVPHRFPTINTCPGHNQGDHSRGDYVMDLEFQKSQNKNNIPLFSLCNQTFKGFNVGSIL